MAGHSPDRKGRTMESNGANQSRLPGVIHRKTGDALQIQRLGPYLLETLILPEEEIEATCYRVAIDRHQKTAVSYHRVAEEFYFVLSGRGVGVIGGVAIPLEKGDFLRLPPGTPHQFITEEDVLEMLNIHCPGSRPNRDVYFLGETPEGFSSAGEIHNEPPSGL